MATDTPKSKLHPSGLDKAARDRVRELIDEWEAASVRDLPLSEHLRARLAEKSE